MHTSIIINLCVYICDVKIVSVNIEKGNKQLLDNHFTCINTKRKWIYHMTTPMSTNTKKEIYGLHIVLGY